MKKMIALLIVLSVGHTVTAQRQTINDRQQLLSELMSEEGHNWRVQWDEYTGIPKVMYNGVSKSYQGSPEVIARQFLSEYYELFSMKEGLTDLDYVKTQTNRGVHHITFQQSYNGVPVHEGQYKVHILENGKVNMANGVYYPAINISTEPAISEKEAIILVKNDAHISTVENEEITSELIVYPVNETQFVLAYKTNVFIEKPFTSWTVFIDAVTGEIIDKINRSNTALELNESSGTKNRSMSSNYSEVENNSTLRTVLAVGNIFETYPGSQSNSVDLERLSDTGNKLSGMYVEVFNDEYDASCSIDCPVYTPQASTTGGSLNNYQFSYYSDVTDPIYTDSEFDEVNLYYHVDRFRNDFIEQIDAGGLGFTKVIAHAHALGNDNATHSFWRGNHHLYFGDNTGIGKPFAWEDKVIYHEYMHAVTYDINSQIGSSSNEEGAINEGISDYMAGSFVNRPKIFNYSMSHDVDEQRDMSSPHIACYSSGCSEPYTSQTPNAGAHQGGEFFSSILWDIRNDAGITVDETDILVYDALYYLDSNPNFEEFLIAMLTADATNYSGDYADIIIDKFDTKGINISITVSGHITSNTNWNGVIEIAGTVHVDEFYTLTIDEGTIVRIDDNKSLIVSPGGKLLVNGTKISPVVFERLDPANDWNRVSLESSEGNSITWALFDGGYINLSIESKNNTIENSTFRNATHRTIQGWSNQDGAGNASATISYSLIDGSPSSGIVANYLDLNLNNTTIQNSYDDGLYIHSATVYPFYQNLITDNGYVNFRDGVQVTSSGTFYMLGSSYVEGYNEISDNSEDQIYNLGDTIVGAALNGDGGYNSVKGGYLGSTYLVNTTSSVNATGTWWGQTTTDPAMFNGTVSGTHLTSDPTTTPGNDGESPAKAVFNKEVNFNLLFDEAEEALSNSTNVSELHSRFHHLYQLEGLANKSDITDRFQNLTTLATQEVNTPFTTQSLSEAYKELAVILYTKSLIRNENYSEAQSYLDQIDSAELSAENNRAYLDLRLVTETYHGAYETALSTMDELYTLHQAKGEHLEEVQSRYSPIREDIVARLKSNDRSPLKEKQVDDSRKETIEEYSLQNYPNPFNPVTIISFSISEKSFVKLTVYDLLGREVNTLVNENKGSGSYTVRFDASALSSGIYIYRLETNQKVLTKRMTVIK